GDGMSGFGCFSAMTGGAGCGRGTACGRWARSAGAGEGRGRAAIAGGLGGACGISLNDNWGRPSGSSPVPGSWTVIGGSSHNAARCTSIDSATATPIRGTATRSLLVRNTSIRSIINPSLRCQDWVARTTGQRDQACQSLVLQPANIACQPLERLDKNINKNRWLKYNAA
ncbi:MAG: hypothetical protein H6R21_972, partial [Proteobacteria bacterium]|nr:hypothetical protein [Pseudomonadota bacterium]